MIRVILPKEKLINQYRIEAISLMMVSRKSNVSQDSVINHFNNMLNIEDKLKNIGMSEKELNELYEECEIMTNGLINNPRRNNES